MQVKILLRNGRNQTHKMSVETRDATMRAFHDVIKWIKRSFKPVYLEAESSTGWIY